jgi:hypothetical protein
MHSIKDWWREVIQKRGNVTKALASLAMLVSWEVLKERNLRFWEPIINRQHALFETQGRGVYVEPRQS